MDGDIRKSVRQNAERASESEPDESRESEFVENGLDEVVELLGRAVLRREHSLHVVQRTQMREHGVDRDRQLEYRVQILHYALLHLQHNIMQLRLLYCV